MAAKGWSAAGLVVTLVGVMATGPARATTAPAQAIGIPAYWSADTAAGMSMFDEVSFATPTVDIAVVIGHGRGSPVRRLL